MKRLNYLIGLLAVLALAACSRTPPPETNENATTPPHPVAITAEHVKSELVVGAQDEAKARAVAEALGARLVNWYPAPRAALIELPAGLEAGQALAMLKGKRFEGVRYIEPNFVIPAPKPASKAAPLALNDPLEAQKWDHEIMRAQDAWGVDVDGAGTKPSGEGVVVAVIDTGIDGTHPDLAGSFVNGWDAVGCTTSGVIPPGYDASAGQIHGTHVAGIIAARGNNGQGVAGVAYKARLMDIQVFCGSGTTSLTIANAIWAAITDADGDGIVPDVINMSLGGKGYSQVLKEAIDSALTGYDVPATSASGSPVALPLYDDGTGGGVAADGVPDRSVTVVVAMGNSSQDERAYPAGYPGVIAVGATNPHDEKASFSTSGGHISLSAPGVDILSTWPTWDTDATGKPFLYYRISGTSMATPQVAGAAALVKQFFPGATPYQVRELLERTAVDIGPAGFDRETGWGRLDLKNLAEELAAVWAGSADLASGGTAWIPVTTANLWDADADGTLGSPGDTPFPLGYVDVRLLQGGTVKYLAKTDQFGNAFFTEIEPGDYKLMVAGEDITDGSAFAAWPYERVSWDADGDPSNGTTLGDLTIAAGTDLAAPAMPATTPTLDSTMEITLEWTGGGDLDLAVFEFDPSIPGFVWSTAKTGGLWGTFSGDDTGSDPTSARETYTLNAVHYPSHAAAQYLFSVDASGITNGTTVTVTLSMNGYTKRFGPIPIPPGGNANANFGRILSALMSAQAGFTNAPVVY